MITVLRPLQDIHVTDGQEVEILLYSPAGERSARPQAWLHFLRDTEPLSGCGRQVATF
ncbi:MAG: hypothetical protein KatS3mg023_3509 [Armatimonadota bacterium]|nr:MAG: hypothetical protein KatS3mg023_3509 [Armatimonadota bacterium]